MNDSELSALYERALASRKTGRGSCPALEEIRAAAESTGDSAERVRQLNHIMGCAECRTEFELFLSVRLAEPHTSYVRRFGWAAAAAVVLLGLGVLTTRWIDRREPLRGGGALRLVAPADGASVPLTAGFVWRSVPGALDYRLEILTKAGDLVFEQTLKDTVLAEIAGDRLEAGQQYLWLVVATVPPSVTVRSAAREFTPVLR